MLRGNLFLMSDDGGTSDADLAAYKAEREAAGNDEQSSEERIEWLRARGVTVDMPEDRQPQPGQLEPQPEAEPGAPQHRYTFVHIPLDDSLPYKEMTAEVAASTPGDDLMRHLKPHFADGKDVDHNQLMKQYAGTSAAGVSASALQSVSAAGSVESFPLVRPSAANGHQGVFMYLDEVGALKKLGRNSRANALAQSCGFSGVDFFGDLYIGRVAGPGMRSDPALQSPNRDFQLSELDSSADWVRGAATENMATARSMEAMGSAMGATTINMGEGIGRQEDDGTKGYSWEQTEDDIEIEVPVPEGTRAKGLKVSITPRKVTAVLVGGGTPGGGACKLPLTLELFEPIRPDESTWTVDGNQLLLTLEKAEEGQWPMLVTPSAQEEMEAMQECVDKAGIAL